MSGFFRCCQACRMVGDLTRIGSAGKTAVLSTLRQEENVIPTRLKHQRGAVSAAVSGVWAVQPGARADGWTVHGNSFAAVRPGEPA